MSTSNTTGNKALISGVTGFVGAHTALSFLQHGWHVRGTVRTQSKGDKLASLPAFKQYASSGQLELVIVDDVVTGDFSSHLKDIQYFVHTASPFATKAADNRKDFLDPAIKGTENAIAAAHKAGVKHISITSSFASILDPSDMQKGNFPFNSKVYTESDWNPITYDEAANAPPGVVGYVASKVLAEKAAWEYQSKHNLQESMHISTICPPMIFGPFVHTEDSSTLGESEGQVRDLVTGKNGNEIPPAGFPQFADVRDVAEAHFQAVQRDHNGRIAISSGWYDNQVILDLVHQQFPDQAKKFNLPVGEKGKYINANEKLFKLSPEKSQKVLGLKYPHSQKDTFVDTVKDIYAHLK